MGDRRPTLSHANLVAFIRRESDAPTRSRLEKLKREEPVYQTLFDLIALCEGRTTSRHTQEENFPQSFPELEDLLLRLYADEAGPEEAGQMLEGLVASPLFYQRVLIKLETLAPQSTWQEAAELGNDAIKSDDEVLEIVRQATPAYEPIPQRRPTRARLWLENFGEDVQRLTARPSLGVTAWNALTTLLAGLVQGVAYALDFVVNKPGYALAAPLLVILALNLNRLSTTRPYDSDKNLLYSVPGAWRGPETPANMEVENAFYRFKARVKSALGYYLEHEYPRTVAALESLRPQADSLSTAAMTAAQAEALRDYYFYTGVSYLSWSRSRRFEPSAEEQKRLAAHALYWLARAEELAQGSAPAQNDRETFFLGLAYGFADRKTEAVARLQKIPETSSFYDQSVERINAWSKP